ncbi:MAG: hypothetical protein EBX40_06795, partial [Gammaproteobacteria bacterium]|nr:hypothetical protein [Gammaproteobacteria bacterium]
MSLHKNWTHFTLKLMVEAYRLGHFEVLDGVRRCLRGAWHPSSGEGSNHDPHTQLFAFLNHTGVTGPQAEVDEWGSQTNITIYPPDEGIFYQERYQALTKAVESSYRRLDNNGFIEDQEFLAQISEDFLLLQRLQDREFRKKWAPFQSPRPELACLDDNQSALSAGENAASQKESYRNAVFDYYENIELNNSIQKPENLIFIEKTIQTLEENRDQYLLNGVIPELDIGHDIRANKYRVLDLAVKDLRALKINYIDHLNRGVAFDFLPSYHASLERTLVKNTQILEKNRGWFKAIANALVSCVLTIGFALTLGLPIHFKRKGCNDLDQKRIQQEGSFVMRSWFEPESMKLLKKVIKDEPSAAV